MFPFPLSIWILEWPEQVLDIYDSAAGMLRIGPFNYDPIRGVDLWLAQSDEFLLTHLSTSPEVEPPHFTNQVGALSSSSHITFQSTHIVHIVLQCVSFICFLKTQFSFDRTHALSL